MEATAANVHDMTAVPQLIHREEERADRDPECLGVEESANSIIHNNQYNTYSAKLNAA